MRPFQKLSLILAALVALALFFYACLNFSPVDDELRMQVNAIGYIGFFETKYLYAWLHVFTFLPVFLMSFDKRVAFHKKWPVLIPTILISGFIFVLWDTYFTSLAVWGFNPAYLSGIQMFGLPLEEVFFFITVPYACVFIHACLEAYFPEGHRHFSFDYISLILGLLFLIFGLFNFVRIYTGITFSLLGLSLVLVYIMEYRGISKFLFTYAVSTIPFLLVNGVLTGGFTQEPVVIYNDAEVLGMRVFTIPVEDFGYNMLYLLGVIVLLDWFDGIKGPKYRDLI